MKQLKQCLREEQERSAAAWRAATHNRSAPLADVRVIFDEGHRLVEAKMKLKVRMTLDRPTQLDSYVTQTVKTALFFGSTPAWRGTPRLVLML